MSVEKRAGIVYYGPYPENRGIRQLRQALESISMESFVLAMQDGKPNDENDRISYFVEKNNTAQKLKFKPIPFNGYLTKEIDQWVEENEIDCIFMRETPLSQACLKVGKIRNIPVYLDVRENLAAMYDASNLGLISRLVKNKLFVRLNEKLFIPKFDHIFSVSDELGEWVAQTYSVNRDQITTFSNYPSKKDLKLAKLALTNSKKEQNSNSLSIVHAGYVKENRGIQDIFKAIALLKKIILKLDSRY